MVDLPLEDPETPITDPDVPDPVGVNFTDDEGTVHNYVGKQEVPLSEAMVKRFNPQEGIRGRDGGPYLDDVERMRDEERRAFLEKREPDYRNTLHGGVEAHQLVDNLASNPGSWEKDPRFVPQKRDDAETTPSDIVAQLRSNTPQLKNEDPEPVPEENPESDDE